MKIPTSSEIETAKLVIDKILTWNFLPNSTYRDFWIWKGEYLEKLNDTGLHVGNGETKICFISDVLDNWVIKTSYLNEKEDSCLIEFNNYNKACESRLNNYFAAMYDLGNGFYLQERAHVNEDENDNEFFNYVSSYLNRAEYEDEDDFDCAIDEEIFDMRDEDRIHAMLGYSEDIENLIAFCGSYGINDLHTGNWGLTNRGYVMIDYSGYN